MTRVALLDVNVLVALFDPEHIHHEVAHDWFTDESRFGFATCPVTENGFVRVLANPARGESTVRAADLIDRLRTFCASSAHVFWPDSVSLSDTTLFNPALVRGHRQVTDIYLLGLACKMGGRLVTFDQSIPLAAVVGATGDALAVVTLSS